MHLTRVYLSIDVYMTTLCILAACSVTSMFICMFLIFVFFSFKNRRCDHQNVSQTENSTKSTYLMSLSRWNSIWCFFGSISNKWWSWKQEPDALSDRDHSSLKLFKAKCWQHFRRWLVSFRLKKKFKIQKTVYFVNYKHGALQVFFIQFGWFIIAVHWKYAERATSSHGTKFEKFVLFQCNKC